MTLPIDQREAFSLHYQLGLTYLEASELLSIPEGTVKSRANNAKVHFVAFLKKKMELIMDDKELKELLKK
jgi:DNA-directed RNA polymerase specialized sigma24 family protein